MPIAINDEQRSMIASIVSAATSGGICDRTVIEGISAVHEHLCLCCAEDALDACARIVGREHAERLWEWIHGELGCGLDTDEREQRHLDKISELDTLPTKQELADLGYVGSWQTLVVS